MNKIELLNLIIKFEDDLNDYKDLLLDDDYGLEYVLVRLGVAKDRLLK
jgi:hypothetical protein